MADETSDDVMHSVCDPDLPDAGEVWGEVLEQSGEWFGIRQGHLLHRQSQDGRKIAHSPRSRAATVRG
jgi:hypothetical protein